MKRKMTRFLALLMAIIMCIPNSITALAAEMDTTPTTFMATISQVEHGTIVFTGYTGDTREYSKGDKVDVTLKPDQGYQVSQFKVTNTDTGKVLAQKTTNDTRFTFAMPEKNVTVTAVFDVTEKAIELPESNSNNSEDELLTEGDDEEGEPSVGSEESTLTTDIISLNLNEEIAEEVEEIAQEKIDNADGYSEETMREPLTTAYDENGLAQTLHSVTLMYTIVDTNVFVEPPMGADPFAY